MAPVLISATPSPSRRVKGSVFGSPYPMLHTQHRGTMVSNSSMVTVALAAGSSFDQIILRNRLDGVTEAFVAAVTSAGKLVEDVSCGDGVRVVPPDMAVMLRISRFVSTPVTAVV